MAYYSGQDQVWEVIDAEHEGQIEIGEEEHGLHIDLIARHRQTGEIFFWDHISQMSNLLPSVIPVHSTHLSSLTLFLLELPNPYLLVHNGRKTIPF